MFKFSNFVLVPIFVVRCVFRIRLRLGRAGFQCAQSG
jgi:hypothetical protein